MRSRSEAPVSLVALERWMQARIVAPHEKKAPLSSLSAKAHDWIEPSATLAPDERVAIYANMYGARMHDALAEDYPAVRVLMGDERFARLVRAYLEHCPSRHASLNELGASLPRFLRAAPIPRRALLHDIATLELAITHTQLAANVEPISRDEVAAVPADAWMDARFTLAPYVQLLELDHRANEIVSAARQDRTLPSLRRVPTRVVVWRKGWTVWRKDLEAGPFAALRALSKGKTLAAATRAAHRAHAGHPTELETSLQHALAEWLAEGLFTKIDAGT